MSENRKENAVGVSAAARVKKRNMLKRQRLMAAFAAFGMLLLIAALCVVLYLADIYYFEDVNGDRYTVKRSDGAYALYGGDGEICGVTDYQNLRCYLTSLGTIVYVDPESGVTEVKVVVDTEGSEIGDYGTTVMMFKEMTYDEDAVKDKSMIIESIEVENSMGGYTFVRNENDSFSIKGSEGTPYSSLSFAILANTCGRTRATRRLAEPVRLPNGEIDYSEYGLVSEMRVESYTDSEGNEAEREYLYVPTTYTVTAQNGDCHRVTVGDLTVTGTGYYAKYEGGEIKNGDEIEVSSPRDTVYVLGVTEDIMYGGYNGYELINGRIEIFATPKIVSSMTMTDYFNVSDFVIRDNIDYHMINKELSDKFGEDDMGSSEFLEEYARLFDKYSHKVCDFSFYDMEKRNGSLNAYVPYVSHLDYARGYDLNGDNVDVMLRGFYQTEFIDVIKIAPTGEELDIYGLAEAPYVISFLYKTKDSDGNAVFEKNYVDISEKQSDGSYYAYSQVYDMIVSVKGESFAFLEWDETYWYNEKYIQLSISNIDSILIESPAFSTEFTLDDTASKYLSVIATSQKSITAGGKTYTVKRNESGKFVLTCDGKAIEPWYEGDYMVAPVTYTVGERQASNYIFSESSEVDINGDGENDGIIYYFYDIVKKDGDLYLVAQIVLSDYEGNPVSDTKAVFGELAYESSYFVSDNGYIFFADKGSSIGSGLDDMYGNIGRGSWGYGRMFITSNGQNVVIDNATGNWFLAEGITCGLYLADSKTSRLAQRAVEIPAKYGENGKLKRYSDIYYPMTDKKIAYLEEEDVIAAYDEIGKEWKKLTYGECTIGVWGNGAYYVLENGATVLVDASTGDISHVSTASNQLFISDVYADRKLLSYTISKDGYSASSQTATAMKNFQEFYKYLLTASFEGLAGLDEARKEEYRGMDDFASGENDACVLKITLSASDLKGNRRETVYRFYRYSERRAYMTVEVLDGEGSSSDKAYGNFDVLYSFVRKVIEDAEKVVDAEPVYSSQKY